MFLDAVLSSCWDTNSNLGFDRKIGIWSFITKDPARHLSRNWSDSTIISKEITSTNANLYRQFLIEKVLTATQEKWLGYRSHTPIDIQQDNTCPHVPSNVPAFVEAVQSNGLHIRLVLPPPNISKLNVLYIGFFNSI